jgi:hypothetical protein
MSKCDATWFVIIFLHSYAGLYCPEDIMVQSCTVGQVEIRE